MAKKKYFPNNWDAYNEVDPEMFEDLPFDQFMDWKVGGWELPSSVSCIIREKNLRTGKNYVEIRSLLMDQINDELYDYAHTVSD
jgi:hypothetical protein